MNPALILILLGSVFLVAGLALLRLKPRIDRLQDRITGDFPRSKRARAYHISSKTAYTIFIFFLPLFGIFMIINSISRL
jgi:hypothetical protein